MLLAKLALGFFCTATVAGVYAFHEGVMRVEEDHFDGNSTHVWVPAALVPMALHLVPERHLQHAVADVAPWLPTLRALTKELEQYPEVQFVDIEDNHQHVRVRTHQGKLLIDVTEPGETVHVSCPLTMMEDVASELQAKSPRV